jgi:hypothetical protein
MLIIFNLRNRIDVLNEYIYRPKHNHNNEKINNF